MTFSYSSDPSASSKDAVRFLLRDTTSPGKLQDEEIAFLLTNEKNIWFAAAAGADIIGANYAGQVDKTIGPLSIRYGELQKRWEELGKRLRAEGVRTSVGGPVFANVPHLFAVGQDDYFKVTPQGDLLIDPGMKFTGYNMGTGGWLWWEQPLP